MILKLSKRLSKIVDMCEPCDIIADVGADHGKVAIAIANKNISKTVLAIDNKKGPIESCKKNAILYLNKDSSQFETSLSNGIEKLDRGASSGIIIAGIGYDNMIEILSRISEYNFRYLILSPHTKVTELIVFLDKMGICVAEQESVYEDDKYYYIIKGKRKV